MPSCRDMAPYRCPGIADRTAGLTESPRGRPLEAVALAVLAAAVLYLALAARVGFLGVHVDDSYYGIMARALAEGRLEEIPDLGGQARHARFPLGYPALLALVLRAVGDLHAAVAAWEFMSAAAGAAFTAGMYLALTRVWGFGRLPAFAAVALMGLHPVSIRMAGSVMSDHWASSLALLGLVATQRALDGGRPRSWLAGCLGFGGAIVFRLASGFALIASGLVLVAAGKRREAAALLLGTAILLAPYLWVFGSRHLQGYGDDFTSSGSAIATLLPAIGSATYLLLTQTLPGLVAPALFLPGVEAGMAAAEAGLPPGLVAAGLACSALLLLTLGAGVASQRTRLMSVYGLAAILLVVVWSAPFKTMGWELQTRLLLPVAPAILAIATAALGRRLSRLFRNGLLLAAMAALCATSVAVDQKAAEVSRSLARFGADQLQAVAYLRHIPRETIVGAIDPYVLGFYADRVARPVFPSIAGMREARSQGVRVLVAQPVFVGRTDIARQAVLGLLKADPPEARILYAPSAHFAVVQLIDARRAPDRPKSTP